MGFALAWVAVKGRPVSEILRELRLRPTGARSLEGEVPFVGALLDTGWYLIVMPGGDRLEHYEKTTHPVLAPSVLARLSSNCQVVTCSVEEHVIFSQATGWRNGERVWTVTHEPQTLDEEGTLPAEYAQLRDRLVAQQEAEGGASADVDSLFEIPVVLVQTFVGYKHDEVNRALEAQGGFDVLESDASTTAKPSFLGRLFKRRPSA